MVTSSGILARKITRAEEPGGRQSTGLQKSPVQLSGLSTRTQTLDPALQASCAGAAWARWGQQRAIGGPAGTRGPPGSPGWRAGTQGQSPGRPCMLRHGTGRGSIQQPSESPGLLSYCLQFLFHTLLEWSFKIAVPM